MRYLALGNPLWSCQLQILGGVRRLVSVAGVYGALLVGTSVLWIRAEGGPGTSAVMGILRFLAAVQIGILLLGGPGAIHKALLRDYSTRMTDTLRTSPMRGWTVLAGYVFGGSLQILTLFVVGTLVGVGLIRMSGTGLSASAWISGNLAVLMVAASVWAFVAFCGLGSSKPANVTALILILAVTSQLWLFILPSLGLFSGAYAAVNAYPIMLNQLNVSDAFGLELAVAGAAAVFWSWAAVRRYRKPWLPALNPPAALLLVGLVTYCCVAAVLMNESLFSFGWQPHNERETLLHATFLAPLLVLHLPAAMAVQVRRRLIFGARPEGRLDSWPPLLWAVLSAVVVIAGTLTLETIYGGWGVEPASPIPPAVWRRGGSLACAYLLAALFSGALQIAAGLRLSRGGWATVVTFTAWVMPPALDILRLLVVPPMSGSGRDAELSWLFGCSPIGTMLASLGEIKEGLPIWPGVAVQAAVVVVAVGLAGWAERGLVAKRAQLRVNEAAGIGPARPVGNGAAASR